MKRRGGERRAAAAQEHCAAPASAKQDLAAPTAAHRSSGVIALATHVALALLAAALAAFLYAPAVRHQAVYDDAFALASPDLHAPWPEWAARGLWRHDWWGSPLNTATSHQQWRPALVAGYRFSLRMARCSAADVAAHALLHDKERCDARPHRCLEALHAHGVALHAANAALLYGVVAFPLLQRRAVALAAAALFAAHPVHAESVGSVYGRADVQALLLQQAALLAAYTLRTCAGAREAAALALALLSALSKENGASTLALLPFADFLLLQSKGSSTSSSSSQKWRMAGVCVFAAFAGLGARGALLRPWGPPFGLADAPAPFLARRTARVASAAWLHVRYVEALLLPWRQAANHGFDSNTLVLDARGAAATLPLIVALYGAAAATVALLWRARDAAPAARPALLCVAWGVASFLPSSNIAFQVGTTLGERLLYLPSAPACALAAMAAHAILAQRPDRALRGFWVAAAFAVLVALAAWRSRVELAPYRCDAALWAAAHARYPDNVVAANNLAVRYDWAGRHDAALRLYDHIEAVWARADVAAAAGAFLPGQARAMSLAENAMRRAAMGRARVLRPMLRAASLDPRFSRAGARRAASLDDAAGAAAAYVEALQGAPDEGLAGRILARLVALCGEWPPIGTMPLCAQAADMLAQKSGK